MIAPQLRDLNGARHQVIVNWLLQIGSKLRPKYDAPSNTTVNGCWFSSNLVIYMVIIGFDPSPDRWWYNDRWVLPAFPVQWCSFSMGCSFLWLLCKSEWILSQITGSALGLTRWLLLPRETPMRWTGDVDLQAGKTMGFLWASVDFSVSPVPSSTWVR